MPTHNLEQTVNPYQSPQVLDCSQVPETKKKFNRWMFIPMLIHTYPTLMKKCSSEYESNSEPLRSKLRSIYDATARLLKSNNFNCSPFLP